MATEIISYGGSVPTGATYYSNPDLVNQLASILGGTAGTAASSYFPLLSNVTSNPLYQSQLQGVLQSLQPSEQRATTGLQDLFRSAGMTNSGAFAQQAANLQRDILSNRTQAAGKLAGDTFGQLVAALNNPLSQSAGLINALKLQQSSSYQQPSIIGGGGTGGSDTGSFLAGNSPFNAANDPYFQAASGGGGSTGGRGGPNIAPLNEQPYEVAYSGGVSYRSDGSQVIVDPVAYAQVTGNYSYGTGQPQVGASGGGGGGDSYYGGNSGMPLIGDKSYYDPVPQYYGWNSDQNQPLDQWGYTESDWQNDPYYY